MKLPIRSLGLVAAGLLLGTALAPVAAQQQQSGVDGQVAVRSDGAVYLISGGQRRWVASVVISDDEINGYPEGEPIYAGLAPMGSAGASQAAAPPAAAKPAAAASPQAGAAGVQATPTKAAAATATPDPSLSPDLLVEVDIDGSNRYEPGDSFAVDVKTKAGATCELTVKFPGASEASEDSKTADSRGKCRYNIDIPKASGDGEGTLIGFAREGGKVNSATVTFEVKKK